MRHENIMSCKLDDPSSTPRTYIKVKARSEKDLSFGLQTYSYTHTHTYIYHINAHANTIQIHMYLYTNTLKHIHMCVHVCTYTHSNALRPEQRSWLQASGSLNFVNPFWLVRKIREGTGWVFCPTHAQHGEQVTATQNLPLTQLGMLLPATKPALGEEWEKPLSKSCNQTS